MNIVTILSFAVIAVLAVAGGVVVWRRRKRFIAIGEKHFEAMKSFLPKDMSRWEDEEIRRASRHVRGKTPQQNPSGLADTYPEWMTPKKLGRMERWACRKATYLSKLANAGLPAPTSTVH